MKRKRANFKLTLRQCKKQNERNIADSLARKLLSKDTHSFWKNIKNINHSNNLPAATTISGVNGMSIICNKWQDYYNGILNGSNEPSIKSDILNKLRVVDTIECFTLSEVTCAVNNLKKNTSTGKDCLSSEHFILCS
jgi:hypothetical protein